MAKAPKKTKSKSFFTPRPRIAIAIMAAGKGHAAQIETSQGSA
jgi:hypothetical protein